MIQRCVAMLGSLLITTMLYPLVSTSQAAVGKSISGPETSLKTIQISGESLVLAGTDKARLIYTDIVPGTIVVRNTYEPNGKTTVVYEQGRDYVVNYRQGTIARSPVSRIPDFSKNILYGQKSFDHNKFPGHGNHTFFVWVDYKTYNNSPLTKESNQSLFLLKTREKLETGQPLKIIAFGDSITEGGEASTESLRYQNRYVDALRKRFPKAEITLENGATGGDTTIQGLARLEEKVLSRKPDLVLVAFGMNDHNNPSFGVPVDQFEQNLGTIIDRIREHTSAEVILLSTFPPNPDWAFGSHQMEKYAHATKHASETKKCAYADVYSVWEKVLKRKDSPSLLGNNINHPNDFGHWLYLQALEAIQF